MACRFDVITLFPEMFDALNYGIPGRALTDQQIEVQLWNPRDYAMDKHRTVDDKAYGGGPGMVMKVEPLAAALQAAQMASAEKAKVIYLSPQGKTLSHDAFVALSKAPRLILLAGRYEGVDERVLTQYVDEEWSIGDYVLSGGEFAAMVMIDAITRLLPGVLGDERSAEEDSFVDGLLDYPHYTRPEVFQEMAVPGILLSGNHQAVARWRRQQSLGRTWQRRPDLLSQHLLSSEDEILLNEFIEQLGAEKHE